MELNKKTVTKAPASIATSARFGIEDVTSTVDRTIQIQDLTISKVNGDSFHFGQYGFQAYQNFPGNQAQFNVRSSAQGGFDLHYISLNPGISKQIDGGLFIKPLESNPQKTVTAIYAGIESGVSVQLIENTGIKLSGSVQITVMPEYPDNNAALAGGALQGSLYKTGDLVKIVHY